MGVTEVHGDRGCPVLPSILCQQCHTYGHFANQCGEPWPHWTRPISLEDLIPAYLRDQFNITTSTPFVPKERRREGTDDQQLARRAKEKLPMFFVANYLDTAVDKDGHTGYDRLGLFMKTHTIDLEKWYPRHTKKTKEDGWEREQAVKAWCLAKGYALRIGGTPTALGGTPTGAPTGVIAA